MKRIRVTLVAAATAVTAATLAGTAIIVPASIIEAERVRIVAEATTESQNQWGARDHHQLAVYATVLQSYAAYEARLAITNAEEIIASSATLTDTTGLSQQVADLGSLAGLAYEEIKILISETDKQATETANAAAAEAARIEAERARALAHQQTPNGARELGAQLASSIHGWGGDQFNCLNRLWTKESEWKYDAYNKSGGATGIPQSLPGSKMATFGADYLTNPATQIKWGLDYIKRAYGSPCAAWNHSVQKNWY